MAADKATEAATWSAWARQVYVQFCRRAVSAQQEEGGWHWQLVSDLVPALPQSQALSINNAMSSSASFCVSSSFLRFLVSSLSSIIILDAKADIDY